MNEQMEQDALVWQQMEKELFEQLRKREEQMEAERIANQQEADAMAPIIQTEAKNRKSIEATLRLMQDEMRAWVVLSNSAITEVDMKKGIKAVMRSQIKLIRLVLNRLEGLE